ncbi:hypothetical protein MTQ01_08985 [Streptomyces sp. XM4193]|uniref:hypothetical protein n=1 Tax=Streptomyces sp. XM4193 TaxID=2929782 RepID=UPI001FFAF23F|nr:hypothetical protein [Streptomyces sp. XM4193]MCK1796137.1 hypothetical protein [Streptomyces sp. XM4193]
MTSAYRHDGRLRTYGYRCELVACAPELGTSWLLAREVRPTPRLAVRWLREQAARVSRSLGQPDEAFTQTLAAVAREPLSALPHEIELHVDQSLLTTLTAGEPIALCSTVGDTLSPSDRRSRGLRVGYVLSALPIPS